MSLCIKDFLNDVIPYFLYSFYHFSKSFSLYTFKHFILEFVTFIDVFIEQRGQMKGL